VTLLLTVFADGVRRVRPMLIFNGQEEPEGQEFISGTSHHHPGVVARRHPLARLSDRLLYCWLTCMWSPNLPRWWQEDSTLLLIDLPERFKTSRTTDVMDRRNVDVAAFLPEGCRKVFQPQEICITRPFLDRVAELARTFHHGNEREYEAGQHNLRARRRLLCRWVEQAWEEIHEDPGRKALLRQTFRETGLALPPDGSKDHALRIRGLPNLSIGNIDPIYQRPTGFLSQVIAHNLSVIERVRGDAAAGREAEGLSRLDEMEVRYAEDRDSETEDVVTTDTT
jgi:hypothetical protein